MLRGILQGVSSSQLARELGATFKTVLEIRHAIQANAEFMQPKSPLHDARTETDEMFQNAGEKRRETETVARLLAFSVIKQPLGSKLGAYETSPNYFPEAHSH